MGVVRSVHPQLHQSSMPKTGHWQLKELLLMNTNISEKMEQKSENSSGKFVHSDPNNTSFIVVVIIIRPRVCDEHLLVTLTSPQGTVLIKPNNRMPRPTRS